MMGISGWRSRSAATSCGVSDAAETFKMSTPAAIRASVSCVAVQVELLSKEMGYSSRQFYRKLKPLTDKSPADIIKEYRLSTAERLLVSSNFTIEELMDRTGFTNRSTFYKAFSQRYGMPPRQY